MTIEELEEKTCCILDLIQKLSREYRVSEAFVLDALREAYVVDDEEEDADWDERECDDDYDDEEDDEDNDWDNIPQAVDEEDGDEREGDERESDERSGISEGDFIEVKQDGKGRVVIPKEFADGLIKNATENGDGEYIYRVDEPNFIWLYSVKPSDEDNYSKISLESFKNTRRISAKRIADDDEKGLVVIEYYGDYLALS